METGSTGQSGLKGGQRSLKVTLEFKDSNFLLGAKTFVAKLDSKCQISFHTL